MGGTDRKSWDPALAGVLFRDSLFLVGGSYQRRAGGDLQFDGERPGEHWSAHGYFARGLVVLDGGRLVGKTIWKRRWRLDGTNTTCHSRPPDDLPFVRSCTLVVVMAIWTWIGSHRGLLRHAMPVSHRTVQRWTKRALAVAVEVQHAVRFVLIESCEPRPVEDLFPGGLSPPEAILRRWRDPTTVSQLWRAFTFALEGAARQKLPLPILLAEARKRSSGPEIPFPL